jgi:hypothetical protein
VVDSGIGLRHGRRQNADEEVSDEEIDEGGNDGEAAA